MNNMSMSGMNSVGGPVGGMPMMNNGAGGQRDENAHSNDMFAASVQLNTYIYDYFLKNGLYACARSLLKSNVSLKTASDGSNSRTSPGLRRDADGNVLGNGVDDNAMDASGSKDDGNTKRPDDLPDAKVPQDCPSNSFLFDWWCVFWEMYAVQRRTSRNGGDGTALAYMQHTQVSLSLLSSFHDNILIKLGPGAPTLQARATTVDARTSKSPSYGRPDESVSKSNDDAQYAERNEYGPK